MDAMTEKRTTNPEKRGSKIRQTRSYCSQPEKTATMKVTHDEERR